MAETIVNQGLLQLKNVRNILDNGGFNIWQRGTSFSAPPTQTYTADRWKFYKVGTQTTGVYRSAGGAYQGVNNGYALNLNCTARTDARCTVFQVVENSKEYLGQTLTFSAWVKTNTTGFKFQITDSAGTTDTSEHTGGNTWERLTATIAIPKVDNSTVSIVCSFGYPDNASTTFDAYIDDAMLNIGTEALEFVPDPPAIEIERCQRYYQEVIVDDHFPISYASGTQNFQVYRPYNTTMQQNPSRVVQAGSTVYLLGTPTTINSVNSDTANWGYSLSGNQNTVYVRGQRTSTQGTHNIVAPTLVVEAEVT